MEKATTIIFKLYFFGVLPAQFFCKTFQITTIQDNETPATIDEFSEDFFQSNKIPGQVTMQTNEQIPSGFITSVSAITPTVSMATASQSYVTDLSTTDCTMTTPKISFIIKFDVSQNCIILVTGFGVFFVICSIIFKTACLKMGCYTICPRKRECLNYGKIKHDYCRLHNIRGESENSAVTRVLSDLPPEPIYNVIEPTYSKCEEL